VNKLEIIFKNSKLLNYKMSDYYEGHQRKSRNDKRLKRKSRVYKKGGKFRTTEIKG